ncbi:MAG: hypothetical protein HOC70_02760 [Gammaproteobacteria bacterium]|jgi:hypothetical protein|nr:hypothetical protein [Gammaproteobacteria bacterium]MBT4492136.1 hypothetical protein [Gammaproteobacteria bacterium]
MTSYIIGDLHGHYRDYERLLKESRLCDDNLDWSGGDAQVWLMGDFFDRGASGIRCLDLTMKLQQQAVATGGSVNSLLGNHELMILCAYTFNDVSTNGESIYDQWLRWGGIESDFDGFTETHAAWIRQLPAMARFENSLLIHADAMLYVDHGLSIEQVNSSFTSLMTSTDVYDWLPVLSAFSEHMAFSSLEMTGQRRVDQLLSLYGGDMIIHGHTPIPFARQVEPESVTEAWLYAGDRCLNVDGGMYMGSPGFIHEL